MQHGYLDSRIYVRVFIQSATILAMAVAGKESGLGSRARLGGRMNWLLVVRNSML